MRVVRTLLLGAVLTALALANPVAHAGKDAASHLASLVEALPSASHFHHPRNAKHLSHLFKAQQASGVCDTAAFAQATSKVVGACPSLSGLVSGTTAAEEFLPTFCQSECYQVLLTEFKANLACIDGQTLFLVGMVSMCETRPHCYTKAVVDQQVGFEKECGAGLTAIGNVTELSTADLATTTCAGNCRTRLKDLYTKNPECMVDAVGIPKPYAPLAAMLDFMCGEVGGVACTKSLRGIARLNCVTSTCSNTQYWCKAVGNTCDINPSADNLKSLCNSCVDGLIMMADAPGGNSRDAIKTVASKEMLCGRVNPADANSNLCYPTANPAITTALTAIGTGAFTTATNDAMCVGDNLKCLPRTLGIMSTFAQNRARDQFRTCVGTAGKTVASCQPQLETDLANAEMLRAMSAIACEDNRLAAPANLKCLTVGMQLAGFSASACRANCLANANAARDACFDSANAVVGTVGCCGSLVDPFVAAMLKDLFAGSYLPPGAQSVGGKAVTFTANLANSGDVDATKRPLYPVRQCQNATADQNALQTQFETRCPARSAVAERSLKIFASFERANAKGGLLRKLALALRTDLALNLGVPVNWILNPSIAEDTTVKINLRVKAARRQMAVGTGNGMKLTFSIDGLATADVTAAANLFDARVNSGTLYAPAAASVLEDECTDCSDAYSSSMVRPAVQQTTAAPGTFVTTMAAGSASAVSTFVVAAVAVVVAIVA